VVIYNNFYYEKDKADMPLYMANKLGVKEIKSWEPANETEIKSVIETGFSGLHNNIFCSQI